MKTSRVLVGIVRFFVPNPFRGTNVFQQANWAWREIPVPVIAVRTAAVPDMSGTVPLGELVTADVAKRLTMTR